MLLSNDSVQVVGSGGKKTEINMPVEFLEQKNQ